MLEYMRAGMGTSASNPCSSCHRPAAADAASHSGVSSQAPAAMPSSTCTAESSVLHPGTVCLVHPRSAHSSLLYAPVPTYSARHTVLHRQAWAITKQYVVAMRFLRP